MLRATTKKPIKLAPVHPNAGLQVAYRKKLDALIDEMHTSLMFWLKASYRANEPELAQDASPAATLNAAMAKLARRWQKRFNNVAPGLAKYFATHAKDRSDFALKAALKKAGFTVEFKVTPIVNDVLQATIAEQVGLIKSIAQQHLTEVQGLVMRSVQNGRDLSYLSEQLVARYGVTKRRAALIARDQNNKATANITRVRQEAIGIKEAIWMHSHGGREPRKSHQDADGKKYDVKKGMLIDGEYIRPGQLINCRCVSRSIIPGLED